MNWTPKVGLVSNEKCSIAKKLLVSGMKIEEISKITELSEDKLMNIIRDGS